jgi:hypothetical protein
LKPFPMLLYTTRLSKIAISVIHMTDRALWLGHYCSPCVYIHHIDT